MIKPAEDFLETKIAGETTHSPTEETYTPEESPVISKIRQSEDTAKDSIEGVSEIITEDETLISQRDTKDNENKWGDETSVHRQEEQDFPLISSFSNADVSLEKDKEIIDLSAIGEDMRRNIEGIKGYPYLAIRRGVEGTVVLFVKLDAEGKLIKNHIKRSSGYEILDAHAVSLVKRVCPFKHTAKRDVEIELPVTYRLVK